MSSPSYLSPSGLEVLFVLLGIVAVGAGLLVVTTRYLVHAALWLVVCLGAVAGCFLVLTAEFVAWVQVLIYVGAVVVLLLFGLMLTHAPTGPSQGLTGGNRALAAVVAVGTGLMLIAVTVPPFRDVYLDLRAADGAPAAERPGSAEAAGSAIFRSWVLPFEAVSVLLLAALIGAIVLSRRDIGPAAAADPG